MIIIFGGIYLLFGLVAGISGDLEMFMHIMVLANIWIAASFLE